jgi:hypothetical protein
MSTSESSANALPPSDPQAPFARLRTGRARFGFAAALLGAFVVGGGATALALQGLRPALVMLTPSPIASMHDWSPVAVKGQVTEIFGNKFIVQDPSGQALVETGRAGEGGALVAKGETVTVQGRFEHGFIHAAALSHADGRNDFVGPPGPPPPPPGGPQALRGSGPAASDPR